MGYGSGDGQDRVRLEKAQAIGLFRFQLISPAIDDQLSTRARGVVVRGIAQGWHSDPFGNRVRYSRDTVDRWIRAWRQGGFAALVPSPRQTALRTDADIMEVAAALKRENPARTAAQVQRILVAAKGWAPSQSTLLRLFHRLELPGADGRTTGDAVFGRFEAGDPNELWTGDALHGRRVGGRKTYLFAFIDDHSRLIPGHRWGFAEDTVRLAAAFRRAVQSRGVPGGSPPDAYRVVRAQERCDAQRARTKEHKLVACRRLHEEVNRGLKVKWSPEQISARLVVVHPDDPEMRVSHETIYQSLYLQARGALRTELILALRQGRARRVNVSCLVQ